MRAFDGIQPDLPLNTPGVDRVQVLLKEGLVIPEVCYWMDEGTISDSKSHKERFLHHPRTGKSRSDKWFGKGFGNSLSMQQ